jgi:predicted nucleic acid-binding protein
MKVVVDTSVWSLALRRRQAALSSRERSRVELLGRLIDEFRVVMLGPIRQELLSGIRRAEQFTTLRERLRAFPDEPLQPEDYEEAAAMGNACRAAGLAVSAIDLLICAVTIRREAELLTTDADFERYAKVLPLRLISA